MKYQIEIRVGRPSETLKSKVFQKQIEKDFSDILVLKINNDDANFHEIIGHMRNLIASQNSNTKSEFVSFYDCRYIWSSYEMDSAQAFTIRPHRRYYNEVENEKTLYTTTSEYNLGFKRIQTSPLCLPKLKNSGSEIKYLSNGSLIINRHFYECIMSANLQNLQFLPIFKKQKFADFECQVFDGCISSSSYDLDAISDWYQILSKYPAILNRDKLDPLGLSYRKDSEPYSHIFADYTRPLTGTMNEIDGAFSDIGFGGLSKGLWQFYRPLIISKSLLKIFQSAKQSSLTFDPFFS